MSTAGQFRQQRSLADEMAQSVLYAIIGHAIWIAVFNHLFHFPQADLDAALMHAVGQYGPNAAHFDVATDALTSNFWSVVAYFGTLNAFAVAFGSLIRFGREQEWKGFGLFDWLLDDEPSDKRFQEWSNFLEPDQEGVEIVRILATVINLGSTPYLFVGKLEKPYFGLDGNPDRFILSGVMRRPLRPGEGGNAEILNSEGFHEILGDNFVIRACEATTLNILVRYLREELPPILLS